MKKKRILCYGDSNTWGYNPASLSGEPYKKPWPDLLDGYETINCGMNGREIPDTMMKDTVRMFQSYEPVDLLIVVLGTNDLLMHADFKAEDVTKKMSAFLTYVRNQMPELKILLVAPPLMQKGEWVQEERLIKESQRLQNLYRNLADKIKVYYANAGRWNIPLMYDGVHMTEQGHHEFAEHLQSIVQKIFYL